MSKDEILADWVEAVDAFYSRIEEVVSPLVADSFISVYRSNIRIEEAFAGTYNVPTLELRSGPKSVTFTPIGRIVAGATGRIDATGSKGLLVVRLLRAGIGESARWMSVIVPRMNKLMELALPAYSSDQAMSKDVQTFELNSEDIEALLEKLFAE